MSSAPAAPKDATTKGRRRFTVDALFADHRPQGLQESTEALLRAADAALYEAKREGRDRVVVYGAPELPPPKAQQH